MERGFKLRAGMRRSQPLPVRAKIVPSAKRQHARQERDLAVRR